MIKLPDVPTVFFDVDDTLVLWDKRHAEAHPELIVTIKTPGWYEKQFAQDYVNLVPHPQHVEAVKSWVKAGRQVVVWSAGGADWAVNVCEALGISDIVTACMNKPASHYDDLDCGAWIGTRYYSQPHWDEVAHAAE